MFQRPAQGAFRVTANALEAIVQLFQVGPGLGRVHIQLLAPLALARLAAGPRLGGAECGLFNWWRCTCAALVQGPLHSDRDVGVTGKLRPFFFGHPPRSIATPDHVHRRSERYR